VRRASNLNAREALAMNVIDVVAPSLPALLNQIDGRTTKPKGLVLHTAGAEITHVDMPFWSKVLDTLIDPNLIVLFMSIGTLGIIVELWNPGLIFPGTVGSLLLFDPAGESYEVSLTVVLAIAATLAVLMAFVAMKIVQVRRLQPVTGSDELRGQVGVARQTLEPTGTVFVHGELWQARASGEPIPAGTPVRVTGLADGLTLEVEPIEEEEPAAVTAPQQ
jgi:membrane-bound serine protease (ClpP class)